MDLFDYFWREASEINIGAVPLDGPNPIRTQSMMNTSTMDTEACVKQARRIVDTSGEYVRLTTRGVKEAENLMNTNVGLRSQGYMAPLVADVHFNPKMADIAAQYAEKVRTNSGNCVSAARISKRLECTDKEYAQEIQKIHDRFVPFLNICKEIHTAIHVGVNHDSLSDRVMSCHGDTPEGTVESCMEFLRICVAEHFTDVVTSIKASNTMVMVKTVRLLAAVMEQEGVSFPLHLGVTEVGDEEDGRIKSALGIDALLCGELGDMIHISPSEVPEAEIPIACKLVDYVLLRQDHPCTPGMGAPEFNYLSPSRRKTQAVRNIGDKHLPVVVTDHMDGETEINPRFTPDYIYAGRALPEQREEGVEYILDADVWEGEAGTWPVFNHAQLPLTGECSAELKFLFMPYMIQTGEVVACLKVYPEVVATSQGNRPNRLGEHRTLVHQLMTEGLGNPVVFLQHYAEDKAEDLQVRSAADVGALIFNGLRDGIFLFNQGGLSHAAVNATAFGILRAGRTCTSKIKYISYPDCDHTLCDLGKTITRIEAATPHLKGLKIDIIGRTINGPDEMVDADYGYADAGRGKINLYKGKICVEKNVPEGEAVERLLEFIHNDRKELEL